MSIGRLLAAKSIASSPMGGLSEPLISKTGGEDPSDEETEDGHSSSIGIIIGAVLLGTAGIAASTMAMVSAAGIVAVYLAGGLCVFNSTAVVKNQYEISKAKGYREGINLLRREANRLGTEIDHLVNAINDLQHEADLMKTFEVQLSDISRKQGIAVNEILSLCKENEEILARQKANLKQIFLSNIAKAFISSEFLTSEMKLDLKNLPLLMMRLQIQLNSHGMQLDIQEFEAMVHENNDVGHIIKCCGEMLNASQGRGTSKVANLVTLDAEHSKGSVEVARGGKATLSTKPICEHRNTVVRDVKRGLSMKGIQVDSDSSDMDSDYDEELHDRPRTRKHKRGDQEQTQAKASSKFKAAARVSRLQQGATNRENTDLKIAQNKEAEHKGKLKSAALMASAAMPKSRRSSETADSISRSSSKSDGRRRSRQSETTRKSFTAERFPSLLRKTKSTGTASTDEPPSSLPLRRSSSTGIATPRKRATVTKAGGSNPDLRSNRRPASAPRSKSLIGTSSPLKSGSRRKRQGREDSF